uniref:Uncharacterized protein n=1 Tax=Rhizophora mucronata TaxID=61149 RepID=A0A2P2IJD4_RHIMU
MEGGGPKGAS